MKLIQIQDDLPEIDDICSIFAVLKTPKAWKLLKFLFEKQETRYKNIDVGLEFSFGTPAYYLNRLVKIGLVAKKKEILTKNQKFAPSHYRITELGKIICEFFRKLSKKED